RSMSERPLTGVASAFYAQFRFTRVNLPQAARLPSCRRPLLCLIGVAAPLTPVFATPGPDGPSVPEQAEAPIGVRALMAMALRRTPLGGLPRQARQ
ncbi:MAG TPA: hypothetical protein VHN20_13995, partial [Beijerinckiaceae bacterium]|nr:hypothetical protein [Beijerinckiaceae bacterium]